MKKIAPSSTELPMTELRGSHEQSVREASTSENPHDGPAPQEEETNLSDMKIADKLRKNPLISAHINAVQNWSEIVFGKTGVMDTKIEKILENPSVSNRILLAISLNPQSIHSLAGKNVCGIKNRTRKNATESLTPLYDAIRGLAQTSEHAHSRMRLQAENGYEKPMEGAEALESLLASYNHARETSTLDDEMMEVLTKDPFIQKHKEQIQYGCIKVFGHPDVLNEAISDITRNPRASSILLHQLREMPEIYHSPIGFNICGFKTKGRIEAEANMKHLISHIQFYCDIVQSSKEFLKVEHAERQERNGISQDQTSEAALQDIQHARAEHHTAPQQEQSRRSESRRMALAM
ncbi:BID domain-containing T4SS effector [Bartonella sp. B23]